MKLKGNFVMNKKFNMLLAIMQIIVGILAAVVFVKNIFAGGAVGMTVIAFMAMILGLTNGIRGICNKGKC